MEMWECMIFGFTMLGRDACRPLIKKAAHMGERSGMSQAVRGVEWPACRADDDRTQVQAIASWRRETKRADAERSQQDLDVPPYQGRRCGSERDLGQT